MSLQDLKSVPVPMLKAWDGSQFLIQHPDFKAASTEMNSEYFSADWSRLYEEENEYIQNVYHIAIAYD